MKCPRRRAKLPEGCLPGGLGVASFSRPDDPVQKGIAADHDDVFTLKSRFGNEALLDSLSDPAGVDVCGSSDTVPGVTAPGFCGTGQCGPFLPDT